MQIRALVRAGDAGQAENVGTQLIDDPGLSADRRAAIHVSSRGHPLRRDHRRATHHVQRARELGDIGAGLDAVGALVALDAEHPTRPSAARTRRRRPDPPASGDRLRGAGLLGRLTADPADSLDVFGQMLRVAEEHELPSWRVQALQEIVFAALCPRAPRRCPRLDASRSRPVRS